MNTVKWRCVEAIGWGAGDEYDYEEMGGWWKMEDVVKRELENEF